MKAACSQSDSRRSPGLDPSAQLKKAFPTPVFWLCAFYSLFQTFEISEEVLNCRLRELAEQFAMDCHKDPAIQLSTPIRGKKDDTNRVRAQRNHNHRVASGPLTCSPEAAHHPDMCCPWISHARFEIRWGSYL